MSEDEKIKESAGKSTDEKSGDRCCCYVDPCGCYVDPCACSVDPCGCSVDACCC
jgi:hypothetical protein